MILGWTALWILLPWIYVWTFYGRVRVGAPADVVAFVIVWVAPWLVGVICLVRFRRAANPQAAIESKPQLDGSGNGSSM